MDIIICENCQEENKYGEIYCNKCGHKLYYNEEFQEIENEANVVEESVEYDSAKFNQGMYINLTINEAIEKIENSNIGLTFSIHDARKINFPNNKKCIILVGSKYYYRARSYVSAIIVLENSSVKTAVHIMTSGGGDNVLGFDAGAESEFKAEIESIFKENIITE